MTDAETSAAVEALAHRLRLRDEAVRSGEDYADADVFSLEFMTAMLGHGWRHFPALAPPKPAADAEVPEDSRRAELLAPVRAHMAAINEAKRVSAAARQDGAA
jgi:hypothetical protein